MSLKRKLKRKAGSTRLAKAIQDARELYSNNRFPEAVSSCRKIIDQFPKNSTAYRLLGMIAMVSQRYNEAITYFEKAAQLKDTTPELLLNLGIAYRECRRANDSRKTFQTALKHAPRSFDILYHLGILESRTGRTKEALQYLTMALEIEPENSRLINLLADIHIRDRNFARAIQTFETYLARRNIDIATFNNDGIKNWPSPEENDVPIIVQLSNLYLRSGQLPMAESSSHLVLHMDPDNIKANLVLATIDRQNGDLKQALDRLQPMESINENSHDLAAALTELGRVHDRMKQYKKAFSIFSKANQTLEDLPSTKVIDRTSMPLLVQQCREYCARKNDGPDLSFPILDDLPSPLFLAGFPRSGTTLTERIIQSQLDIQSSDELPLLHEMTFYLPQLLNRPFMYPNDLDSLTSEEIHFLRNHYWQKTHDSLGISHEDRKIFLDKLPLNILHLIFIERVFPESKVIIALRDPRDVCLSNFMQFFGLNSAMIHFLNINDTARLYAGIMDLWLTYRQNAGIEWHETRYEDLIDLPENTIRELVQFITGQKDNRQIILKDHTAATTAKTFSTPSYFDVTQPIYSRASGRWRNYAENIAPVIPVLEKFITGFGYTDT